jgi:hypothetical protein
MATNAKAKAQIVPDPATLLTAQYGCGPVQFAGTKDALYERHLLFDIGLDPAAATARDRFEALILQLSHHRRVRQRDLEPATVPSTKQTVVTVLCPVLVTRLGMNGDFCSQSVPMKEKRHLKGN